jgi:predicted GIY-YIG superfamily endonuclease
MTYTYTYIVECRAWTRKSENPGTMSCTTLTLQTSYYVGGTNNPRQRIEAHLAGKGAKYLRGREILRVCITDIWKETTVKRENHDTRRWLMERAFNGETSNFRPFWHRTPEGGVFD